ncbi:MAG: universal stress protein [Xenococcaceae cyanobacterium MO_188.B32]|nr:universal stress protein [Xenococcaceae cyanobacterium MO_188.B32]
MFRNCLICTDFTDGLHRLVNFVPDLAKGGLQQVVFFHSVPLWEEGEVPRIDEEKVQAAKESLSVATENAPADIEVKIEVLSGKPSDTIPRILKKYPIEVILTGTPIRSLLQEKFLGSTSSTLARQTEQPITIIRPQLITTYTREELALRCQHLWRYLLIPYNDGKAARYLIERIKKYASDCPEISLPKCMLIWVVDEPGRRAVLKENRLQQAREKLESTKAELEQIGLEVNLEVREGNPLQEILSAALTYDISAIAIADDYRNKLLEWTAPSLTSDLFCRSWFPLLLFSPKK